MPTQICVVLSTETRELRAYPFCDAHYRHCLLVVHCACWLATPALSWRLLLCSGNPPNQVRCFHVKGSLALACYHHRGPANGNVLVDLPFHPFKCTPSLFPSR